MRVFQRQDRCHARDAELLPAGLSIAGNLRRRRMARAGARDVSLPCDADFLHS